MTNSIHPQIIASARKPCCKMFAGASNLNLVALVLGLTLDFVQLGFMNMGE